ncbi:MAG: excinuclease ABC subunit UvrA, partial [Clostridiales bacterium]|nr:excinuclease ABC subunit UvrA [Clostridiales bacterium]
RCVYDTEEGKRQKKVLDTMVSTFTCPDCHGTRVNERVRSCKIHGKDITQVADMPIPEAIEFLRGIDEPLAQDIRRELLKRLTALNDIGLGYLSLSRGTGTLSGGEAQRIKIAKYIHSVLTDIVYVLDEPSVGLHPRDIARLKKSLYRLRDHGNTILIVEHHREIIAMADYLVDMGPGAGSYGGEILYTGDYAGLLASDTVTGRMLRSRGALKSEVRQPTGFYEVWNAQLHNLKNLHVKLPLGVLTVIAGVAVSGKSSLMEQFVDQYDGEIISIRQKDIGINLRSTPATYLDISDEIRRLFAKENHVSNQLFSFNSKGGCPACKGKGVIVSDMAFMESIETVCEVCGGARDSEEALR